MSEHPWDGGLQNERTALAWQRTLLSGLGCSLLVARLLTAVSVAAAVSVAGLALVGTAAVALLARRRFRDNTAALWSHSPLADGRAPLLVTALVLLTALAAGVLALAR